MNLRKSVLLLTDWYHPGYKAGGPIQSCVNLVNALQNSYSFHVLTSNKDLGEQHPYPGIVSNTWTDGKFGEKVFYSDPSRISCRRVRSMVRETGADTIYLNSMFSYRFTVLPLLTLGRRSSNLRIVLAPRGMLQRGALSFKPLKKKFFLILMRAMKFHRRIVFQATDNQEITDIRRFFPSAEIILAENIPAGYIGFQSDASKSSGQLRLFFLSRLHAKKNLDYFLSILKVERFKGKIAFDVFGNAESSEYLALCKQIARGLPPNITVSFNGGAPHDQMMKKMGNYHAFVLPTRGENFGHSIFEALMSGVPVLVSDQTPWRNLEEAGAGWDIPLDNPSQFAAKVQELLDMDENTHRQWRLGARRLAEKYLAGADFGTKYSKLFS